MKHIVTTVSLVVIISNFGISQDISKHSLNKTIDFGWGISTMQNLASVCGNILFNEENRIIQKYIDTHPNYVRQTRRLQKTQNFVLGEAKSWWIQFEPDSGPTFKELPSICKAVGVNCYIFVSDESWNDNKVTQAQVDELLIAFDNVTPNFANKGIYEVDVENFGNPPDFDGDEKIIIFLYDIEDDYESTGVATIGYFWRKDQFPDGDPTLSAGRPDDPIRSNEAEIFYIDTHPLLDIFGIQTAKSTLAHEFQHMIQYGNDPGELTFVNEGLSEIAEYVCGYGVRSNGRYTQNTNVNLLSWDQTGDVLEDYSRAAFWTLYLHEQFPDGILMDLVNNHHSDWTSLDATFRARDINRGFWDVLNEWLVANYVNGNASDTKYTYQYSPLSKPTPVSTYVGNPNGAGTGTLFPLGAEYIKFSGGSDLNITFQADNGIKIYALKIGSLEVEEVDRNALYSPDGFGSTFPEIIFLIYNTIQSDKNYSYIVTGTAVAGTIELAYDDGIPDRPLNLTESDTMTVQFNGIPGGKITSIKAGFLNAGNIVYGMSKFRGGYKIAGGPFGEALIPAQNLNVPTSSSSLDPFDNWITIDLSSQNLDSSDDFIIYFVVGSGDPTVPGLMASAEPDDGLRQMTFLQDQNPPDWFYLTDVSGNIWKYLVRAYVSVGGGTVAIDQTGIVIIPDEFSLEQNYPNPFNPSTTFRFATPEDGLVKFTVHDLLGRVVYSENRNLFAGSYSFTWEGNNMLDQQVVSGIYFLRMEAEGFSQTRKMLMMK
ncbi:MAG: T9SS type A sorting domain-containing protein [Candidatus Neomarinimicrobiota bacterium]